jgi:hypothetical protein
MASGSILLGVSFVIAVGQVWYQGKENRLVAASGRQKQFSTFAFHVNLYVSLRLREADLRISVSIYRVGGFIPLRGCPIHRALTDVFKFGRNLILPYQDLTLIRLALILIYSRSTLYFSIDLTCQDVFKTKLVHVLQGLIHAHP